jgi:hypothetical protein
MDIRFEVHRNRMNYPTAPNGGIAASPGQATGYQSENFNRSKGRGIDPSSAAD